MSENPANPVPPPLPSSNGSKPKSSKVKMGCLGLIGICILISCISAVIQQLGGNNQVGSDAQEKVLKEMGPDNPMAKRINSLNQNNAYGAGVTDGSRETMEVSVRMNWGRDDYQEKLADLRSAKSEAFDLLASQNKFDSTVFQQYKRGWDYGASTLSIR